MLGIFVYLCGKNISYMETFNNQCPFCSSRELGSGTFVFNNVKYSIVCCKSCAKVIVSVKDEAEKQIQELIKEIDRMKKLMGIKDNSGI